MSDTMCVLSSCQVCVVGERNLYAHSGILGFINLINNMIHEINRSLTEKTCNFSKSPGTLEDMATSLRASPALGGLVRYHMQWLDAYVHPAQGGTCPA
jgi:hypothetical protein